MVYLKLALSYNTKENIGSDSPKLDSSLGSKHHITLLTMTPSVGFVIATQDRKIDLEKQLKLTVGPMTAISRGANCLVPITYKMRDSLAVLGN